MHHSVPFSVILPPPPSLRIFQEDEDSVLKRDEDGYGAEAALDMERVQPIPAFCSSDSDSEAPLDWLPMAPEIEDPEEPGWGQLEVRVQTQWAGLTLGGQRLKVQL